MPARRGALGANVAIPAPSRRSGPGSRPAELGGDVAVRVVARDEPDYPAALRAIPSPPASLWWRGELPPESAVAVVGTRRPTSFGRRAAVAVARSAVEAGFAVVSGLAAGIDAAAHRAALDAGGRTFAVLGSGVDVPTPVENRRLAEEIVGHGGGLLAEVPPGVGRTARALVARDRIQSGLSLAVVVCQSEVGGGAMHTARFALAQGRLLVVVRPPDDDAGLAAFTGNLALCAPEGCDPAALAATGQMAVLVAARRPVADLVLTGRGELAGLWATLERRHPK